MASTAVVKTQMKREGLALVTPLSEKVKALEVKTEDDYHEADVLLSQVRQARTKWASKIDPAIKPIRTGLDALYALNREVDGPLEAMEKAVKAEMKDYKLLEARQIREAVEKREAEQRARQAEIDKKKALEAKAKTTPMRERLRLAREHLEDDAAEMEEAEAPAPVKAASSVGRKVKKIRVTDRRLFTQHWIDTLQGDDATPPLDMAGLVVIDEGTLRDLYRRKPEVAQSLPGVEIYDDIEIAGKR